MIFGTVTNVNYLQDILALPEVNAGQMHVKLLETVLAAWKDIPPTYKASCIKPEVFSASYAEWISCLELSIDVKSLRKRP